MERVLTHLDFLQGHRGVVQQVPGPVHLAELAAADLLLNLEVCQRVVAHVWLQWFLEMIIINSFVSIDACTHTHTHIHFFQTLMISRHISPLMCIYLHIISRGKTLRPQVLSCDWLSASGDVTGVRPHHRTKAYRSGGVKLMFTVGHTSLLKGQCT